MNLSAIHKYDALSADVENVVCDIGGYEFVSYSQVNPKTNDNGERCL